MKLHLADLIIRLLTEDPNERQKAPSYLES